MPSHTTPYPCDKGTGTPLGYHHFVPSQYGVACVFCGKRVS